MIDEVLNLSISLFAVFKQEKMSRAEWSMEKRFKRSETNNSDGSVNFGRVLRLHDGRQRLRLQRFSAQHPKRDNNLITQQLN